ncbi:hypothetical protein BH09BAC1_BH09BAC1_18690 [soil metagenome]
MDTTEIFFQAIGYIGGILTLYAYYMVSSNRTQGDSLYYQFYNVLGALCLIVNTAYVGAYPSMGVNIIWVIVAVHTLRRGGALKLLYNRMRLGGKK